MADHLLCFDRFLYCSYSCSDRVVLSNSFLNLSFSFMSWRTIKWEQSFLFNSLSSNEFVTVVEPMEGEIAGPFARLFLLFNFILSLCCVKHNSWSRDISLKACWGEDLDKRTWLFAVLMLEMPEASVDIAGW